MLFALCEIYQAFAVVYKKKSLKNFFKSRFPTLFAWFTGNIAVCQTRTFCVIFGDVSKNSSLTSGDLRSPRDDFVQILITTSLMLQ